MMKPPLLFTCLMLSETAEPVRIASVGDSTVNDGGGWGPGFRGFRGRHTRQARPAQPAGLKQGTTCSISSRTAMDSKGWAPLSNRTRTCQARKRLIPSNVITADAVSKSHSA